MQIDGVRYQLIMQYLSNFCMHYVLAIAMFLH